MRRPVMLTVFQSLIDHWFLCHASSLHRGPGLFLGAFEEVCLG